jgi:hypothetical protein
MRRVFQGKVVVSWAGAAAVTGRPQRVSRGEDGRSTGEIADFRLLSDWVSDFRVRGQIEKVVGATGFEPAIFRSQSGRDTRLRYAPNSIENCKLRIADVRIDSVNSPLN